MESVFDIMGSSSSSGSESGFGAFIAFVILVVAIICWWKIFKKAGKAGFWAIIPYANLWTFFKIATRNNILWFILAIIPPTAFIADIAGSFGLAKAFGKGFGFGLLLLFFPWIGLPILAFGKSEYEGI